MSVFTKTCVICGKEFETTSNRRTYCYDTHYSICKICGKTFKLSYDNWKNNKETCSSKCYHKLHPETKKKYKCICKACGKQFLSSSENSDICSGDHYITCAICGKVFKATKEQIRGGTKTCSRKCSRQLASNTVYEKYGVTNVFSSPEVQEQIRRTNLRRYGYANPMSNPEIAAKSAEKRYEHINEIMNTVRNRNKEKYGVDWVMQVPEIREKARQTCLKKYGVDNFAKSALHVATKLTDPTKAKNCEEFRKDPERYISINFENKPTLAELAESCGMRDSSAGWIISENHCEHLVHYTFSRMEDEVYSFLSESVNTEIVRNTFKVITPYELDLYLPEYKLAIECNPTITHNSSFAGFENDVPKSTSYHKMKTDMCEDQGILLFHIFGYDWSNKKDVIKSMLLNLVGANTRKMFARKTKICEVSSKDAYLFLSENHRQSPIYSKINLGLYYDDSLISLMSFSKMRNTIGTGIENLDDCWELTRFCSKLNYSVVGGASKLFKHFINKYHPTRVRSFSDRAHTIGSLYSILGFEKIRQSDPGYVWVDTKTDRAYSRVNAQKQNISNFLKDETLDLTKSEFELMESHGFVRVYDSGTVTWEWRK